MKFGTDCSGPCCICRCGGLCIPGHGDDDFFEASAETVIKRLDDRQYPYGNDWNIMIKYLKDRFGIDYDYSGREKRDKEKENIRLNNEKNIKDIIDFNIRELYIDGIEVGIVEKEKKRLYEGDIVELYAPSPYMRHVKGVIYFKNGEWIVKWIICEFALKWIKCADIYAEYIETKLPEVFIYRVLGNINDRLYPLTEYEDLKL